MVVAPPCLDFSDPGASQLGTPLGRGVKLLDAVGRVLEATGELGSLAAAPERCSVALGHELEPAAFCSFDFSGGVSDRRGRVVQAIGNLWQ